MLLLNTSKCVLLITYRKNRNNKAENHTNNNNNNNFLGFVDLNKSIFIFYINL